MNEYDLSAIMREVHERDFAEFNAAPERRFSVRHTHAMNKILSCEKAQTLSETGESRTKLRLSRKTLIIAIAAVLFAAVSGCTAAYFISNGFRGDVYKTNTHLFALNTEGAPERIEKEYSLSVLPEGYKLAEYDSSIISVYALYENEASETLVFMQTTKEAFNPHMNTEKFTLDETDVNGCDALYYELENSSGIIWDNGDYILELHGEFSKEDIRDLAISNEKNGF